MALKRTGRWLKMIGTGKLPMPSNWLEARPDVLQYVGFPDKGCPTVEEFDFIAVYLAVHQKAVATLYADSDPYWDARRLKSDPPGRWPWIVDVRPLLVVPDVEHAPHIRELGISGLSVRSHSHIEIDEATWMRINGGLGALPRWTASGTFPRTPSNARARAQMEQPLTCPVLRGAGVRTSVRYDPSLSHRRS